MNEQIAAMLSALDFIETRLQEETGVKDMADAAGYSVFHFIRVFNQTVHHTPYDYLTRRRLSEAARQIQDSKKRIADIAQDYCFGSQENFSRMFRKMYGCSPAQCRKTGLPAWQSFPAKGAEDLQFGFRMAQYAPTQETWPETVLDGLMTRFDSELSFSRQEEKIEKMILDLQEMAGDFKTAALFQVVSRLAKARHDHYVFVGIPAAGKTMKSSFLVRWSIPQGKYLSLKIPASEKLAALRYLYATWMPKNGCKAQRFFEVCIRGERTASGEQPLTLMVPFDSGM